MVIKIPKEQKSLLIKLIQQYFDTERGEPIGDLAAEFLLDFVLKHAGPFIYNQAILDAQTMVSQKMVSLDEDIYAMRMPVKLSYDKDNR